jgi:hypothetical protein
VLQCSRFSGFFHPSKALSKITILNPATTTYHEFIGIFESALVAGLYFERSSSGMN